MIRERIQKDEEEEEGNFIKGICMKLMNLVIERDISTIYFVSYSVYVFNADCSFTLL